MFDRGLFLSLYAIRRQLAAMPHDLYLVRLIHHATRMAFPGERLWTAAQLGQESTVRFLRMRNREGCDVYLQPYAEDRNSGYILLDLDHTDAATLERMRVNGHQPCVVLQTSPGHLQAWIQVSAVCLEPATATTIASWPTSMEAIWPAPTGVIWGGWRGSPTRNPSGAKATGTLAGCGSCTLRRAWRAAELCW